jgi:cytochrome c-type biogenesis protein CcmH/NrfF
MESKNLLVWGFVLLLVVGVGYLVINQDSAVKSANSEVLSEEELDSFTQDLDDLESIESDLDFLDMDLDLDLG